MSGVWKEGISFRENICVCGPAPASQQGILKRQRCHLLEVGALAMVIHISFCYPFSVFFISSAAELFPTQAIHKGSRMCLCI